VDEKSLKKSCWRLHKKGKENIAEILARRIGNREIFENA
jgi:hypothetical protein